MKHIEIFRVGTHTDINSQTLSFTEADLEAAAKNYDPALHEAPIVIGHPELNAPAFGWVKNLSAKGGSMVAGVDQVDASFAEQVKAGRFKKISPSFYPPAHKNNPKPGAYYLRHVGFLGAMPPAVKGLKPVSFAAGDDEGIITLEFGEGDMRTVARMFRGLRDWMIEKYGQEDADKAMPDWDITWLNDQAVREQTKAGDRTGLAYSEPNPKSKESAVTTATAKTPEQLAEEAKALETRSAELKNREAAFAEKELKRRREENAAFLDGLIKDARFPAGHKDAMAAFMERLDGDEVVSFGEGDKAPKKTELQLLKEFLSALPKAVSFSEQAPGAGAADNVELTPQQRADRITAYRAAKKAEGIEVSFSEASTHVEKEIAAGR